jgi:homoserine O-acetyltransferase
VSVRDIVRVQAALLEALGVRRLRLVIGGSLGGMQVLEWALVHPERVAAIAPIAISARHSAWTIAISEAQRQAIAADPRWRGGHYPPEDPPAAGLAAARMLAMVSYRSRESLEGRFGRERATDGRYAVESWLHHHGRALVDRFDANTYVTLTKAMDTHDVGRGRGGWREALATLRAPALVVSIESDVLYPPVEQQELAAALPGARLVSLRSPHGHDAFLIEGEAMNALVAEWRRTLPAVGAAQPRAGTDAAGAGRQGEASCVA